MSTTGQILDLNAGWRTTCASVSGQVQCFGWNLNGQLGIGPVEDQYSPRVVSEPLASISTSFIKPGVVHSCALTGSEEMYCWGSNISVSIGIGEDLDYSFVPVKLTQAFLPNVNAVEQITVGRAHTCAIVLLNDDGHKFWCWGANEYGMLGDDSRNPSDNPVEVLSVDANHVVQIEAGYLHTCAILSNDIDADSSLWCWGLNFSGQLGIGSNLNAYVPQQVFSGDIKHVSSSYYHTCAVKDDLCYCWGDNENGQLGIGSTVNQNTPQLVTTGGPVQTVVAGATHTCALLFSGSLECWGSNENGQLGVSSSVIPTISKTPITVDLDGEVAKVALGKEHTCASLLNQTLWCWGSNSHGQLGIGDMDTEMQFSPALVKIDWHEEENTSPVPSLLPSSAPSQRPSTQTSYPSIVPTLSSPEAYPSQQPSRATVAPSIASPTSKGPSTMVPTIGTPTPGASDMPSTIERDKSGGHVKKNTLFLSIVLFSLLS